MRILCVCEGGNVRSRALAYVLHDLMGHEAIPVGRRWMSPVTMEFMCFWAERIVVMQPEIASSIPIHHRSKVRVLDVGPDTYGLNISPVLMDKVTRGAAEVLK